METWPETVREAIEWHTEAEVAVAYAKEDAKPPLEVTLLDLEADKRNRWAGFVIARALKRAERGVWE